MANQNQHTLLSGDARSPGFRKLQPILLLSTPVFPHEKRKEKKKKKHEPELREYAIGLNLRTGRFFLNRLR